ITVILDTDADLELFTVVGAFSQGGGDPLLHLIAGTTWSDGFPGLAAHLGISKDANDGGAEAGGDFDIFFDMLYARLARGFVGSCEIITDAGAANNDSKIGGFAL